MLRLSSCFKYFVIRSAANAFSIAALRSPNSRSFSTLMTPASKITDYPSLQDRRIPKRYAQTLERETGIEPATNSLEGCDSTTELLPLSLKTARSLAQKRSGF